MRRGDAVMRTAIKKGRTSDANDVSESAESASSVGLLNRPDAVHGSSSGTDAGESSGAARAEAGCDGRGDCREGVGRVLSGARLVAPSPRASRGHSADHQSDARGTVQPCQTVNGYFGGPRYLRTVGFMTCA